MHPDGHWGCKELNEMDTVFTLGVPEASLRWYVGNNLKQFIAEL